MVIVWLNYTSLNHLSPDLALMEEKTSELLDIGGEDLLSFLATTWRI